MITPYLVEFFPANKGENIKFSAILPTGKDATAAFDALCRRHCNAPADRNFLQCIPCGRDRPIWRELECNGRGTIPA